MFGHGPEEAVAIIEIVAPLGIADEIGLADLDLDRSEERRVGKECRSRWSRCLSSRRRHTRWPRDWSSDVCSSDLDNYGIIAVGNQQAGFAGQEMLLVED